MKYRKKPVTVEAFRYDGDLMYSNGEWSCPDWAKEAFQSGVLYYDSPNCEEPPTELYIETLEGRHHVSVGDKLSGVWPGNCIRASRIYLNRLMRWWKNERAGSD